MPATPSTGCCHPGLSQVIACGPSSALPSGLPQHHTAPSPNNAHEKSPPAVMAVAFSGSPSTRRGCAELVDGAPSCPSVPRPQQYTPPAASAHVCRVPAEMVVEGLTPTVPSGELGGKTAGGGFKAGCDGPIASVRLHEATISACSATQVPRRDGLLKTSPRSINHGGGYHAAFAVFDHAAP